MTETILVLFVFICFVQVAYHWFFFSKILGYQDAKSENHKSVSVVIAARNEADRLESLIKVLAEQNHPNYEVIVINDRSTDNTLELLETLRTRFNWLKVINLNETELGWTGKKNALRKGVASAKNDILLFTDADCLPKSEDWINEMTSGKADVCIGFSPYLIKNGFLNQFIQFETLITGLQYLSFALLKRPYMAVGRNWSIKRTCYPHEFLESIKHFEGGDDDLIVNHLSDKLTFEVRLGQKSQTYSVPKTQWRHYLHQKKRHISVGKYYNKKHLTLLGVFTLSHVIGWLMFLLALMTAFKPLTILTIFGLRSLSFYTIFTRVGHKLGTSPKIWALPLLDLCYSLYYPFVGIGAWSIKNIKWS